MVIIINILIIFRPYILYRVTAHLSSYFLRINSKAGIVVQKISKDGALLPLAVSGTSSNMPAFKFSYTFFISQPFGQEQVWYGGFPGGTMVKNPPANAGDAGDTGSILGSGRFPGGGHGKPFQYSCLENPIGWTNLAVYSP